MKQAAVNVRPEYGIRLRMPDATLPAHIVRCSQTLYLSRVYDRLLQNRNKPH
jgi:hypothetical protein